MTAKKTATIVIMSLIFTVVLVALVNVGIALFYGEPSYEDYCKITQPVSKQLSDCPSLPAGERDACCIENNYESFDEEQKTCINYCYDDLDKAQKNYDQVRFYILVILGFIFIVVGLFVPEPITRFSGLGSGGILVIEAVVLNLDNKLAVFITLVLFLIAGIFATIKLIKKK